MSGRISRTATKVTPRPEFNAKGGASSGAVGESSGRSGGGDILGLVSPPEAKSKQRSVVREGGALAFRRMHKSPRASIDRGERESRERGIRFGGNVNSPGSLTFPINMYHCSLYL